MAAAAHNPSREPDGPGEDRGSPTPEADEAAARELRELVSRAASGEEAAWRDLLGRYARRVFALAKSRLGSPELAEEVAQDVFVRVAQSFSRARASGGYTEADRFEPWLFRIAMNRIRDEGRARSRRGKMQQGLIDRGDGFTEHAPDQQEPADVRSLRAAIDELGDADREVVELRHHGQMSFQQIADQLGEPMGTVLARHHRALKKLRSKLEPNDETGGNDHE
ncbi:MAG: sigma-70 family RNA polymerase sigma factor [Planctomycetota bacterium]